MKSLRTLAVAITAVALSGSAATASAHRQANVI